MVLTSDNEGTPLSLVEAAMAGIPSVATNVGSVSEVVIDGESGLLTSTSASSLADACLQLIDAPSERQRLGEAARAHAEATFSSDQFLDRHAQTYLALRAKARHPDA